MGSPSSIVENVAPVVDRAVRSNQTPVVVVSAMSGVTNLLLQAAERAVSGKEVDRGLIEQIRGRHLAVLEALGEKRGCAEDARSYIEQELERLVNLLQAIAVIGELSYRSHDAVMAVGEKLSAKLFSCVLNLRGLPAEYVNLEALISRELRYQSDSYWDEIEVLLKQRLAQVAQGATPVLTGFFGQTDGGMLEAVGRGYSDYCAALAGAALDASEIQIWTDVDGVLSANPKIVPEAFILERVSFDEIAELAHFGAKVLHPYSVRPAVKAGIPLRILNTFNCKCPGTLIETKPRPLSIPFKSIAAKQGVTIVRVTTPRMLMAHGYMAKITQIFARHRISIDLIATSEVSVSFSVCDKLAAGSAFVSDLGACGEVQVQGAQSIISIVGAEMQRDCVILGRVFDLLDKNSVKVNMASLGNALINLSIVINDADCDRSVQLLHRAFFGK